MNIIWNNEDYLMHYGMPRRSGRYKWGSGEDPYHHGADSPRKQYKRNLKAAKANYKSRLKTDLKPGMSTKQLGSTADKLYNDWKNEKKQIKETYKQTAAYKSVRKKKIIGAALGASAIAAGVYLHKNPDAIAKVKKVLSNSNNKQIKDIETGAKNLKPRVKRPDIARVGVGSNSKFSQATQGSAENWRYGVSNKKFNKGDINRLTSPNAKKIKNVTRPTLVEEVKGTRGITATIARPKKLKDPRFQARMKNRDLATIRRDAERWPRGTNPDGLIRDGASKIKRLNNRSETKNRMTSAYLSKNFINNMNAIDSGGYRTKVTKKEYPVYWRKAKRLR